MAGLEVEALYDLLPCAITQPDCLYLLVCLCPKGTSGLPWPQDSSLSILQSKEEAIPTGMEPLQINVANTKVYHCHVQGCPEGLSTSQVAICSYMCQTHLGTKLSCPSCPLTFFNTDTLH